MKFLYLDESGSDNDADVFVMCGIMADAYRIRRQTREFDRFMQDVCAAHINQANEFKASRFMGGKGGWANLRREERQNIFREICTKAIEDGNWIYGIAISMNRFREAIHNNPDAQNIVNNHWVAAGMFICCLVQKHMQNLKRNKGQTIIIIDDNKKDMDRLSECLYQEDPWFDELYMQNREILRKAGRKPARKGERFSEVINTPFAIKSHHSSYIQIADAICYAYRRNLELTMADENWCGERAYYNELVNSLNKRRKRLGTRRRGHCGDFFTAIKHPNWMI